MTSLVKCEIGSQPFCTKCNRVVDRHTINVHYGIATEYSGYSQSRFRYTGQDTVTFTVECHGEYYEETLYGEVPK